LPIGNPLVDAGYRSAESGEQVFDLVARDSEDRKRRRVYVLVSYQIIKVMVMTCIICWCSDVVEAVTCDAGNLSLRDERPFSRACRGSANQDTPSWTTSTCNL